MVPRHRIIIVPHQHLAIRQVKGAPHGDGRHHVLGARRLEGVYTANVHAASRRDSGVVASERGVTGEATLGTDTPGKTAATWAVADAVPGAGEPRPKVAAVAVAAQPTAAPATNSTQRG